MWKHNLGTNHQRRQYYQFNQYTFYDWLLFAPDAQKPLINVTPLDLLCVCEFPLQVLMMKMIYTQTSSHYCKPGAATFAPSRDVQMDCNFFLTAIRLASLNQILDPWVYLLLREILLRKFFQVANAVSNCSIEGHKETPTALDALNKQTIDTNTVQREWADVKEYPDRDFLFLFFTLVHWRSEFLRSLWCLGECASLNLNIKWCWDMSHSENLVLWYMIWVYSIPEHIYHAYCNMHLLWGATATLEIRWFYQHVNTKS